MSQHQGISGGAPDTPADEDTTAGTAAEPGKWQENLIRLVLALSGVALLVNGVIVAYRSDAGVSAAALMGAGAAVLFIAYLGPYVTMLKYKEVELEIDRSRRAAVTRVRAEGQEAVDHLLAERDRSVDTLRALRGVAETYDSLRSRIPAGGTREIELERTLKAAESSVRTGLIDLQTVAQLLHSKEGPGDRIIALAAMRVHPELRDFDLVAEAIDNPNSGFDQDRFLVLAAEMLSDLGSAQKANLRGVIQHQIDVGNIKEPRARWYSARRVLTLMDRQKGLSSQESD